MTALQPLVETRTIGSLRVHAIQAGGQKLDGGAMFGVVPKVLWQRKIEADDRNRIQLGMRCLLIEHESGLILIDTGAGNKEDSKFYDIYGIDNQGAGNRTALEEGLAQVGVTPDDITLVIDTHLHFDHAGGNTYTTEAGELKPSFPKARYLVQRGEYASATNTNERTAASYFARNYVPLYEAGTLDLIDGDVEIVKGIWSRKTPGHTPHHQSIVIESGNERAIYLGDVIPTAAHLPLPWVMGYDLEPLVTLETKRALLKQAMDEDWTLIFEHDASVAWGKVTHNGKAYELR
jgi:glyoxylase-like metal-dependent hydrolase (beta-lactamase superfamily II)